MSCIHLISRVAFYNKSWGCGLLIHVKSDLVLSELARAMGCRFLVVCVLVSLCVVWRGPAVLAVNPGLRIAITDKGLNYGSHNSIIIAS